MTHAPSLTAASVGVQRAKPFGQGRRPLQAAARRKRPSVSPVGMGGAANVERPQTVRGAHDPIVQRGACPARLGRMSLRMSP